jgi:hypothetical protein
LVNSEFYTGWLDYWGLSHARTSADKICEALDQILQLGANVNMYMFEGGTNFGYYSGMYTEEFCRIHCIKFKLHFFAKYVAL